MPASRPSPTILVVDDDPGLTRLIERTLRREGFATACAGSGQEAAEWLRRNAAVLLLLDLKLPDGEGAASVETIRSTGQDVPFIIITGQGDERVAVDMMKRGASDYLVKDANFIDMLAVVVRRTLSQIEKDSRLHAAEEALRRQVAFHAAVMAASGAILMVLDAAGHFVSVNDAFERISGHTLAEVQGRRALESIMLPGLPHHLRDQFAQVLADPQSHECEGFLLSKTGERRWMAWSVTVLKNAAGTAEHIVISGIDITDRRRLEEEILEISERERERIGQDLHDDLGQQLVGAWCMSQALAKSLTSCRSSEAPNAVKITTLLKESVALTRALARGLHPVALQSGGLAFALQELAQRTSGLFSVVCVCHCPPSLEVSGSTAIHLYRIAQEAVTNAVKHGKAREITIEISSNVHQTVLSVKNDGAPLRQPAAECHGMGLRIMRYRADVIGGSLNIQDNFPDPGVIIACAIPATACAKPPTASSHGHEDPQQSRR